MTQNPEATSQLIIDDLSGKLNGVFNPKVSAWVYVNTDETL